MDASAKRLGHLAPELLQAALDRFDLGHLISTAPVTAGNFGQNVFLSTTTGEYVFRGNPFFDWQFPKERLVARILHQRTDVPVSWPYFVERSHDLFGWAFAIMPRLPGRDLWDAPEGDQIALAPALGRVLARLQKATFDEAMEFDMATDRFRPISGGERSWLIRRIEHILEQSIAASHRTSDGDAAW